MFAIEVIFLSYTALYRKLRPKTFNEVVGQEHIVKTLINQIESGRITHAYLFCGTRGTGKTSTAKIFAKAVNCLTPVNHQPCNKCELCQAMNEGRSLNVIEIDAASNNGVENIREIRDEVIYPPTIGKYKIYIIDEVHMLSIGAFNALLKTLEEPPSHVIFILATTDPQKIPVTILSRCQRFDFKRITNNVMAKTLKKYMSEENVTIEDNAIDYIVRISDGAMRDALSILDQCISYYYGEVITLDKVLEISGSVDDGVFFALTDALNNSSSSKCMDIIEEIIQNGRDINQFISEIILHWRNELIAISVDGNSNVLDASVDTIMKYMEQGRIVGYDTLMKLIEVFSQLQGQLKYAFNNRILFEVCCIKFCNATESNDLSDVFQKIRNLEQKIKEIPLRAALTEAVPEEYNEEIIEPVRELAVPKDIQAVINGWSIVKNKFEMFAQATLNYSTPESLEDDNLYIVCDIEFYLDKIKSFKEDLSQKIEEVFGKKYNVILMLREDYEKKKRAVLASEKTVKEENIEDSLKALDFDVQID